MGAYINPREMTKEGWLVKHGKSIDLKNFCYANKNKDELPVVIVNNGPFTAAAIAFSSREFDRFIDPLDTRPKAGYIVKTELLHTVSPELRGYLKTA